MQRDWDLIREILIRAAKKNAGESLLHTEISGYFLLLVGDHIAELNDAGFLRADIIRAHGYVLWATVTGLTAQGYALLNVLHCDAAWDRIKRQASGGSIAQELIKRFRSLAYGGAGDWRHNAHPKQIGLVRQ